MVLKYVRVWASSTTFLLCLRNLLKHMNSWDFHRHAAWHATLSDVRVLRLIQSLHMLCVCRSVFVCLCALLYVLCLHHYMSTSHLTCERSRLGKQQAGDINSCPCGICLCLRCCLLGSRLECHRDVLCLYEAAHCSRAGNIGVRQHIE